MSASSRRTAGLAGLAMPPVCLGLVALATWLERDYLRSLGWTFEDHAEVPYPSATATGDWGFLTIASFVAAAAFAAVLVSALRPEFRSRRAGRVATVALTAYVASFALLAFPTDVESETPQTWHGWLHGIGFVALLLSMFVGYASTGLALRGNHDWHGWRLLLGGWPVLLLVAMFTGFGLPGDTGWYLFLVLAFAWPAVAGARLRQLAQDAPPGHRRPAGRTAPADIL